MSGQEPDAQRPVEVRTVVTCSGRAEANGVFSVSLGELGEWLDACGRQGFGPDHRVLVRNLPAADRREEL